MKIHFTNLCRSVSGNVMIQFFIPVFCLLWQNSSAFQDFNILPLRVSRNLPLAYWIPVVPYYMYHALVDIAAGPPH